MKQLKQEGYEGFISCKDCIWLTNSKPPCSNAKKRKYYACSEFNDGKLQESPEETLYGCRVENNKPSEVQAMRKVQSLFSDLQGQSAKALTTLKSQNVEQAETIRLFKTGAEYKTLRDVIKEKEKENAELKERNDELMKAILPDCNDNKEWLRIASLRLNDNVKLRKDIRTLKAITGTLELDNTKLKLSLSQQSEAHRASDRKAEKEILRDIELYAPTRYNKVLIECVKQILERVKR